MASVFGNRLKISLFGESHGPAIGIVIDGFPAGFRVNEEEITEQLKRRQPGRKLSTLRIESDRPRILGGVLHGMTTGAPIAVVIDNENARSEDYPEDKLIPRPGHADYPAFVKYGGYADLRGGGQFSGRLTAPLVFAGTLCAGFLRERYGIEIGAHISRILYAKDASFPLDITPSDLRAIRDHSFPTIDLDCGVAFAGLIGEAEARGDSVGGEVECAAIGLPVGLGTHPFGGIEPTLAPFLFSIPGVKSLSFGDGTDFAENFGSYCNDAYRFREDKVVCETNHAGGVTGGMSNGMPLLFRVVFKPTPSIAVEQKSVDLNTKTDATLSIKGRHDPCIALRAVPVVESVTAIALTELIL